MAAIRDHQHKIILTVGLTERSMAVKMVVNASGRTTVVPQVQIAEPEYSMTCTLERSRETLPTKSKTLQVRDIVQIKLKNEGLSLTSNTLYGQLYWIAGHKHLYIYPSRRITSAQNCDTTQWRTSAINTLLPVTPRDKVIILNSR